jgi:TetR/AcrR family transcriptional repressor of bet genes
MTLRQSTFTRAAPDARRQSLIEATARCLASRGAAGVSVRAICAEAGVSPGLLRHYFAGVSEAIAETYRWIGEQIAVALDEAVAAAGDDPRARLLAYVTASFSPPIASPDLLASYIALWSLTRSDPAIAAVRTEIYSDFQTGLECLIEDLRPEIGGARLPAVALTALIDGLWLELSLGSAAFSPEEAERLAELWLDSLLG